MAVRLSMALVLLLIGYRVLLVILSLEGFSRGRFDPPPGGLGSPLLLLLLVPFLIALRRFIGAGYSWARELYALYVVVRLVSIAARDPWSPHALPLGALYLGSALLLYGPSARRWFAERRRGRA